MSLTNIENRANVPVPDAPRDRWAPSLTILRVGRLRRRHGLSDTLARTVAGLAYGEGRA